MGEIVLAAKIAHVPSILISERPGPLYGTRAAAIAALRELGARANPRRRHVPHLRHALDFQFRLSHERQGATSRRLYKPRGAAHDPEHGLRLPRRPRTRRRHRRGGESARPAGARPPGRDAAARIRLHRADALHERRTAGRACSRSPRRSSPASPRTAASARPAPRPSPPPTARSPCSPRARCRTSSSPTIRSATINGNRSAASSTGRWICACSISGRSGATPSSWRMLPEYSTKCNGEALMVDTHMIFGLLGWDKYAGETEILCPYFPSSGSGQVVCEYHLS